jgi:hypothetical protein
MMAFMKSLLLCLAAMLILAGPLNPIGDVQADSPVKQTMLTDFEQANDESIARDWLSLTDGRQAGDVKFSLKLEDRDGQASRVLRIAYQLPDRGETGRESHAVSAALKLGMVNLTEYDHLTFLVRGDTEVGFNHQFDVMFYAADGNGQPGDSIRFGVSAVGGGWQRVWIPLGQMLGNADHGRMMELRLVWSSADCRVTRGAYLIDDMALLQTGTPGPNANDEVTAPKKAAWDAAHGSGDAALAALRNRLVGWPGVVRVNPEQLPVSDTDFLRRLAQDTWRGIDALTDREHGLPLDRIHLAEDSVAPEKGFIGDYTSVTNIGFHFLAVVAAYELKLIDRATAVSKLRDTLSSLERMETHKGVFYNYYNTTTLERTSHFLSFVDSAWLTAGLVTARSTFPELTSRCTPLIAQTDYRVFYDEGMKLMTHGYYANTAKWATYHYGLLFTEARLGSLIAIGKGDVPPEHWFAMERTIPAQYNWQTSQPVNRVEKSAGGFHWIGGYYQWRNFRFVPSWGGSMFEALMPALILDEKTYAPESLGKNGEIHTEVQRLYATEELKYPVWGMSPSSTPGVDKYDEFGVRVLGSLGYRDGVVTPHAAALALLTKPDSAVANLRKLAKDYPLYGDFGLYDAVDPKSGQIARKYLCLNQAMILVALADHLADHAVQKHFAADPIAQHILPLVALENFFQ